MRFVEEISFTQEQFDAFARLSGDDNPIHVDPEFAASTLFGRPVAHGMMLFGVITARTATQLGLPIHVHRQELMFPAPTFAGDPHRLTLEISEETDGVFTVVAAIHTGDGTETATSTAHVSTHRSAAPSPFPPLAASDAEAYKGLQLGAEAESTRTFTAAGIDAYCDLVDESNPLYRSDGTVPPPLLGGGVSHLLGVELPGRGTNWLKQSYWFERPVAVGEPVTTRVEIVRFRPAKHLVNLAATITTAGVPAAAGLSLVHTQDVAPR